MAFSFNNVRNMVKKFIADNPIKRLVEAIKSRVKKLIDSKKEATKKKQSSHKKLPANNEPSNEILDQFDNLDMITVSAIAIMLSDVKSKASSPYISLMKKADIGAILQSFCEDTYGMEDIEQIERLFSKPYYKRKINKHMRSAKTFVRKGIEDTLTNKRISRKARETCKIYIDKLCDSLKTFETVKLIPAFSGNNEFSDSSRNYKLDHMSDHYKDALIYLVDILLTCTCISKVLFIERMVGKIEENSEFYRIIKNMTQSIDDINVIINKSRPIYKQYYREQLGYIGGDDLLYGMAITIMVNKFTKQEIMDKDILSLDTDFLNFHDFNSSMSDWLDSLAVDDEAVDVGTLILQRIMLSIKGNFSLLMNALAGLTGWELYYKDRVAYYIKERDKERYLKGDFDEV